MLIHNRYLNIGFYLIKFNIIKNLCNYGHCILNNRCFIIYKKIN